MPNPDVRPAGQEDIRRVLKAPHAQSHKYTRGVLGVLTGSETYPGAGLMSVRAAVNSGVGLVQFSGSEQLNFLMHLQVPEAVCSSADPLGLRVDAWALGSGVTGERRLEQVRTIIARGAPAVLDAAAVALAAQLLAEGTALAPRQVLTPHAGELADFFTWISALAPHLLKGLKAPDRTEIDASPAVWATLAAQVSGATVLLKGGTAYIASPAGNVLTVSGNSPWLATAGSGDTLTGILGALLARYEADTESSKTAEDYAALAAAALTVHGGAADALHAPGRQGPAPATLLAPYIPSALARLLAHSV
ncbi:MAG: ADP/ATP-dependent (S)-NAD(P)H-hydrate dehydratase [Rothia sp. (in: high G+C Gram-positive bacteria)]|nr:ADP/ATP-dependent (S)-NAD(P)H-hydrate dehydratase [Rothia sp. (in: high G+C Gram-positive bacteria)]